MIGPIGDLFSRLYNTQDNRTARNHECDYSVSLS